MPVKIIGKTNPNFAFVCVPESGRPPKWGLTKGLNQMILMMMLTVRGAKVKRNKNHCHSHSQTYVFWQLILNGPLPWITFPV